MDSPGDTINACFTHSSATTNGLRGSRGFVAPPSQPTHYLKLSPHPNKTSVQLFHHLVSQAPHDISLPSAAGPVIPRLRQFEGPPGSNSQGRGTSVVSAAEGLGAPFLPHLHHRADPPIYGRLPLQLTCPLTRHSSHNITPWPLPRSTPVPSTTLA